MGLFENVVTLPKAPIPECVRLYLQAQVDKDYSQGEDIFTENVFFNGLTFRTSGREKLIEDFKIYVEQFMLSLRIEAIAEVRSSDKYMILHWIHLQGSTEEQVICDLLTLEGGKISRVDNCFAVEKSPKEVLEAGASMSAF